MNLNTLIPPAASPNRPGSRGQRGLSRSDNRNAQSSAMVDDRDQNHIFKDRFTNVHSKNQIEKQREFDANKARLQKEFQGLDKNGDGFISFEELLTSLSSKDPEGNFDRNLASDIFMDLDENNDGTVSM
jgi:Ca2+-binding EF-hand superfamily protein